MNPRTLWACQPADFIISASVAPLGLFSSSMIFDVLLPSRAEPASLAALGAFLVALASELKPQRSFCGPCRKRIVIGNYVRRMAGDVAPLTGATCAPRAPARAFFGAFRSSAVAVPVSGVDVMMLSPFSGD